MGTSPKQEKGGICPWLAWIVTYYPCPLSPRPCAMITVDLCSVMAGNINGFGIFASMAVASLIEFIPSVFSLVPVCSQLRLRCSHSPEDHRLPRHAEIMLKSICLCRDVSWQKPHLITKICHQCWPQSGLRDIAKAQLQDFPAWTKKGDSILLVSVTTRSNCVIPTTLALIFLWPTRIS